MAYDRKLSGNRSMTDFFQKKQTEVLNEDKGASSSHSGPSSSSTRVASAKIAKTPAKNNAMERYIGKNKGHVSWKQL